jgi:hypothetical protein
MLNCMAVFTSLSAVGHEHHARFPIQILDPDPVDLSFSGPSRERFEAGISLTARKDTAKWPICGQQEDTGASVDWGPK